MKMDAIAALASIDVPKPIPIILAVVTNPEAIPLNSKGLSPTMNLVLGGLNIATEVPITNNAIAMNTRLVDGLNEDISKQAITPTIAPSIETRLGSIRSDKIPANGPTIIIATGITAKAKPD